MANAPKRFAEMTANEIRGWLDVRGAYVSGFADLRDAIRQEALSDGMAIGTAEINEMSSTIDALRTRAERAEQERNAERQRADLLDAASDNLAYKLITAESALGEARREAHKACDDALAEMRNGFFTREELQGARCLLARIQERIPYPATPSGEGQHTMYPTGAFAATPARAAAEQGGR